MAQDILQKNKEVHEKKIEVLKKRQGKEKEDKNVSGHYDTNRITNQVPIPFEGVQNISQSNRYTLYTLYTLYKQLVLYNDLFWPHSNPESAINSF